MLPYRIAAPARKSRRPVVLVLHGSGAMGSDNKSQLGPFAASWAQLLDDPDPPIVVVPQVATRSADYLLCEGLPRASRPGLSFEALLEFLDTVAKRGDVDPRRIYLVGFSMGGSAALQLALARPHLITGMVVFSPVPPPKSSIAELGSIPMLVVHGSGDTENPFPVMRDWTEQLKAAGGRVRFVERKGMKHQVPDDMLMDKGWREQILARRDQKGK